VSIRTLLILGAGGHGKAVAEAALLSGEWQKVVFADDRWPALEQCFGSAVVSDIAGLLTLHGQVQGAIAAVGNNARREAWVGAIRQAGLPLVSVCHPHASSAARRR
jgi:shikimate 5-dehydrogenase